jgi:Flp pilus assembly pilin Flp
MLKFLARLRREEGQAMVEYALILSFIAAVVVASLTPLGTAVSDLIGPVAGWF